ncbi:hypothetical protein L0P88_19785 [Muricauda sp. SCSIO 64092]|nr:hypothetical protein [Muricauda sp. SCSIO 64092]UOY06154.1 hypothetical protein L0P88_19785 [Muricauda sp. SCSIO 64092]
MKNGQAVLERPVKDDKTEAEKKKECLLRTIDQLKVGNDFLKTASQ